jgi:Uma2 family endonuclease
MAMGVSTLLTEEQFLNLPQSDQRRELLDGELIELPYTKYSHDELTKRIFKLVTTVIPWERVWHETMYRLSPVSRVIPDISVDWPEQLVVDDWKQGAPMLAIEIASRGNIAEELERKRTLYLQHGAAEVWIIYPETHTMLVSRRDGGMIVEASADYRCDLIGVTVTPDYRTPVR